eukprot:312300_1
MNEMNKRTKLRYWTLCHDVQDTTEKMYSLGTWFEYGYDNEHNFGHCGESVIVSSKYSTLKEELTSNIISNIEVQQFNHEYKKAQLHWNSIYCKEKYGKV